MRASLAMRSLRQMQGQGARNLMATAAVVPARAPTTTMTLFGCRAPLRLVDCVDAGAALRQQRRGFAQGTEEPKPTGKAEDTDSSSSGGSGTTTNANGAVEGDASKPAASKADGATMDTAPVGEEPPPEAEEKESPLELLQKELAEAQEKMKKEKHELLLALADFENNKKRYQTECQARRRSATTNFATKMVDVYAKFDELAHSEDNIEQLSDSCKALQEGVVLTRNLYKATLDKFDVEQLVPEVGEALNQARHESLGSIEGASVAAGHVAELVQPGWILEPKSAKPMVLKKAQVKVAAP